MSTNISNIKERKAFYFKLKLSALFIFVLFVIEIVDNLFQLHLEAYGVKPKSLNGLYGVLTFPFIHGDWNHLISNAFSLFMLLAGLFIFHEHRSFKVLLILYLGSGLLLWFIGRQNSVHVGASGLIYALASYLFVWQVLKLGIEMLWHLLFIILTYGEHGVGYFPFVEENVSWEGSIWQEL
ncbi:MAG: rhomboid family intramembrane serine protease [Chitinophagales bacterium]